MSRSKIFMGVVVMVGACTMEDGAPVATSTVAEEVQGFANECPADVPPALAPADDADLKFVLSAQGVQRYTCVGATTGYTWTFIAPDADLFKPAGDHRQFVHHFAGPTWLA